jgi:formylglycine-generating enzyme required for sulfatase activity
VDDAPDCPVPAESDGRVWVKAGEFSMGSPPGDGAADEQPRHRVWVSDFALDKFEVTNRRYRACVRQGACERPRLLSSHLRSDYYENDRYSDFPVVFVDAHQAEAYCRYQGGRLPTEAEWEKAARGPGPSLARFPWGDREPDCSLANLGGAQNCVGDTDRVGRRPLGKSSTGAWDMAGNVWEWVADWYDPSYYRKSPLRDPRGPRNGTLRVIRGGCWESGADSLRVSCRRATVAATWAYNIGFRCAYGKGG